MLKTVTLQEANGLLPLVREHFFRIHVLIANLQALRTALPKNGDDRLVLAKNQKITVFKKKSRNKRYRASVKKIRGLENMIGQEMSEIMKLGAVIKGLMPPHIDFLSIRNNEPIYLCWHGGEKEINHWHRLDSGSGLRQFIHKKSRFGPHMVH